MCSARSLWLLSTPTRKWLSLIHICCVGGCVGGPKRVINQELGRKTVDAYGEKARFETPLENPYVLELLKRLGFDTVEELLSDQELFTRSF